MPRKKQKRSRSVGLLSPNKRTKISEGDSYPLTRGTAALTRINLLQYLWRETLGYLVHPKASISNSKPKLADVATATGLWLCEVHNSSFNAHELHGFDISPDQFIQAKNLPETVELKAVDASKLPPKELRGKYDFVHVRLLQSVIKDDDPAWVISHCKELLRPGGYLQWEEFDPLAVELNTVADNEGFSALEKLQEKLRDRVPGRWVATLPETMVECGMGLVTVDRKREPPWHRYTMTYLLCLVWEEYADVFLDQSGPTASGAETRRLAHAGYREALNGSFASHLFQVVVAQKPFS